ncbi:hypothetical protein [Streptomyces sp. NPDC059278]|uniref:hypothetical protein n=1 Tax=Streptomyces sp. NPDC059278 TaxID=3346801 RepID=UPI0036813CD7
MARLLKIGIRPQQDCSTAMFAFAVELPAELPAVVLARMLDVHIQVALQWQKAPGGDRAAFAPFRLQPAIMGEITDEGMTALHYRQIEDLQDALSALLATATPHAQRQ